MAGLCPPGAESLSPRARVTPRLHHKGVALRTASSRASKPLACSRGCRQLVLEGGGSNLPTSAQLYPPVSRL